MRVPCARWLRPDIVQRNASCIIAFAGPCERYELFSRLSPACARALSAGAHRHHAVNRRGGIPAVRVGANNCDGQVEVSLPAPRCWPCARPALLRVRTHGTRAPQWRQTAESVSGSISEGEAAPHSSGRSFATSLPSGDGSEEHPQAARTLAPFLPSRGGLKRRILSGSVGDSTEIESSQAGPKHWAGTIAGPGI